MEQSYRSGFKEFIASARNNAWLYYDDIEIYVRKSHRCFKRDIIARTFDVANIKVNEQMQGQGIFTHWLTVIEDAARKAGFECVYVESLLNPRLADFLARRGYTQKGGIEPPSYYLMLT
jgi:N-acetylglutamate synthase and related acetyltransferases